MSSRQLLSTNARTVFNFLCSTFQLSLDSLSEMMFEKNISLNNSVLHEMMFCCSFVNVCLQEDVVRCMRYTCAAKTSKA